MTCLDTGSCQQPSENHMQPSHPSTLKFLNSGIFDDLKCFSDLEKRIAKLEGNTEKGDAFEIFVEGYIATHKLLQAKQIWTDKRFTRKIRDKFNLPPKDFGVDGVFETLDGELVPYQVKFRSGRPTLSLPELGTFFTVTQRAGDRVIFTNSRDISIVAMNRDNTRSFRGHDFDQLTEDDLKAIAEWLRSGRVSVVPRDPRPHQAEAINKVVSALTEQDRATAVMACGTGKTMVALWTAERMQAKRILVLLPSLALLKQTLEEWSQWTSWGDRYRFLCVCSDKTVARGKDNWSLHQSDTGFRVSTDPSEVGKFLKQTGNAVQVVYSTYQSAHVIAEGLDDKSGFDLAIFDEAHKTAGREGSKFAFALNDTNLRIKKRLFMTATPRHYDIRKARTIEGDFKVTSMDDEAVYGPVAYRIPFAEAARQKIICDYKVLISVVDDGEVNEQMANGGVTLVDGEELSVEWVAHQIALQKAVEEVGASRIITFHSDVKTAQEFSGESAAGVSSHLPDISTFHVNGSQTTAARSNLVDDFRKAEKGLITNARCLTEGVDVPAVDMVAFMNPRKSKVDIVQAIGRAMRKAGPEKKFGYVVVPLFLNQDADETIEEALVRSDFSAVADVVNAMREQDDDLVDVIREMRFELGRDGAFDPSIFEEKVSVIGSSIDLSELRDAINAQIVETLSARWDEMLGLLTVFKNREGHCNVLASYVENDQALGNWVSRQRQHSGMLSSDQIKRLDALGFVWGELERRWEENFAALQAFHAREGHFRVPKGHVENGLKLRSWVSNQRIQRNEISEDRIKRLDALGFVWSSFERQWEESFAALRDFHNREHHSDVFQKHIENGLRLGIWVGRQRKRRDSLSSDQIKRLDALGFVWDVVGTRWEENFAALEAFQGREHHCKVPREHTENGQNLRAWVSKQRKEKDQLTVDQIDRLNALGFIWNVVEFQWDENFAALRDFHNREHHCNVPRAHIEDGLQLGHWVNKQRSRRNKLSADRIKRLKGVDFVWES